ncbi:MAG TPA: hypothetical protein ENI26_07910 [Methylophaga aminisulfidivorans]|uniref:Uncharacterized protein n=2 Tax=root TaxID=1 RepID=A0A7C1VSC2_9GAMM|nr:hypothetical protein [Methylophaga sp.]HEC74281.1 hypothetical protein [Methylophaga aminisulfidivorans]
MGKQAKTTIYLKKALFSLGVISIGIIVLLVILYAAVKSDHIVTQILNYVNDISSIARYLRWLVVGAIIIFWDEIVDYVSIAKGLEEEQKQRAKSMRWHVLFAVLAFEILVVEALPAKFMS